MYPHVFSPHWIKGFCYDFFHLHYFVGSTKTETGEKTLWLKKVGGKGTWGGKNLQGEERPQRTTIHNTATNLAPLQISVHCQALVRSQYLVRLFSLCWIKGGHTIHPPIKGLIPPTGIEPTPIRNSAFKVVGSQVHATTPG